MAEEDCGLCMFLDLGIMKSERVIKSEVEQRQMFVMGVYGQHRSKWVKQ